MKRSMVVDIDLQKQLYGHIKTLAHLLSFYLPEFVDEYQAEDAYNVHAGTNSDLMSHVGVQPSNFKAANALEKDIVL